MLSLPASSLNSHTTLSAPPQNVLLSVVLSHTRCRTRIKQSRKHHLVVHVHVHEIMNDKERDENRVAMACGMMAIALKLREVSTKEILKRARATPTAA